MPSYRKTTARNSSLDGKIGYRLGDPEHKQIVRSSDVVFNESAMHKTAERPIEVRRVIFSEMPTFHDGPAHNTRSVSRVTDISSTESSDSAQPNGSTSNHPTPTPGATSPVIPRRSKRLSQPPERYSPRISLPTPANRLLTKKHRQLLIQPHGIWRWSCKCTPFG